MALGALSANPDSGLKIIPCGMNYFHAHKFRSRAVIEFGSPVEVTPEMVQQYQSGEKREAVKTLLENIYNALVAVTVTSPDYDTLMVCFYLIYTISSLIQYRLSMRQDDCIDLQIRSFHYQWLLS